MSQILLDTSAYSALFRKHPATVQLVESAESLYLSPIVLGELKAGFLLGKRGEENERTLREFLQSPRVRVLTIDDETADRWAIIAAFLKKSGTPVASNDIWIAASAMQHGLPILTSDRDFQKIPQVIVHHFSPV
jgi:predicted nucleic acid-binding protein